MKFRLIAFSLLLLLPVQAIAASHEGEPGYEAAKAIEILAQMDWEVDIQHLTHFLKLPELEQGLTWHGPYSRANNPRFSASYTPPNSELGITGLGIEWSLSLRSDKSVWFNSLSIGFKPGACPSEAQLADLLKVEAREFTLQGADGGPSYQTKSFSVAQTHGSPVIVGFSPGNTCQLTISNFRDL